MHKCSLDVVDRYPDGSAESSVAMLLGVTEQAINAETKNVLRKPQGVAHPILYLSAAITSATTAMVLSNTTAAMIADRSRASTAISPSR